MRYDTVLFDRVGEECTASVFRVLSHTLDPEDGGSKLLHNVSELLLDYTAPN